MNIVNNINDLIASSIGFVQTNDNDAAVAQILKLTQNLFYLFDHNKNMAYKIAYLTEYVEGIQEIIPNVPENLVTEIIHVKDQNAQQQIVDAIVHSLSQLVDVEAIHPPLVTFWLKRTCHLHEVKVFSAFMLFLNKSQQAQIFAHDPSLLQDKKVNQIIKCLVNV